jgi:hypothetical protein
MTKLALVLVIACGWILGQVGWELLGLLVNWIGKAVGWAIAASMKRMIAARQEQALAATAAVARQRPPLVTQTGGTVDENQ